jgi:Holliday junction resolvase RusA-like endonuclease
MPDIILQIDPCPKPRMTVSDRWNHRPPVVRYRQFRNQLQLLWGDRVLPDTFHVIFIIKMPQSWSKKKRGLMCGKPHQCKPDTSNLLKGFEDVLLENDSVLWDIRSTKLWGEKGGIILKELEKKHESYKNLEL